MTSLLRRTSVEFPFTLRSRRSASLSLSDARARRRAHSQARDVDFNLDADFDKLSSFKVNMPDLDFSSPSENSPNNKDRNEAESTDEGNSKKRFSYSFDFNEQDSFTMLDGFNLDSPMIEGEQVGKKVIGNKGRSSEMNEHQGSKTRLPEAIPDCADDATKDNVRPTQCVGTSEIQIENSVTSTSMPNPRIHDWVPKSAACRNSVPEQSSLERTKNTCAQECDQ